jgi:hypothetical protein
VIGKRELPVQEPFPMVEVWEELQAQVEHWTGDAGQRIIDAILEDELARPVGQPPQARSGVARCELGTPAGARGVWRAEGG